MLEKFKETGPALVNAKVVVERLFVSIGLEDCAPPPTAQAAAPDSPPVGRNVQGPSPPVGV